MSICHLLQVSHHAIGGDQGVYGHTISSRQEKACIITVNILPVGNLLLFSSVLRGLTIFTFEGCHKDHGNKFDGLFVIAKQTARKLIIQAIVIQTVIKSISEQDWTAEYTSTNEQYATLF